MISTCRNGFNMTVTMLWMVLTMTSLMDCDGGWTMTSSSSPSSSSSGMAFSEIPRWASRPGAGRSRPGGVIIGRNNNYNKRLANDGTVMKTSPSSDNFLSSVKINTGGQMKLDPPLKKFPPHGPPPVVHYTASSPLISGTGIPPMLALSSKPSSFQKMFRQLAPAAVEAVPLHHAPLADFAVDLLTAKGPRPSADVGDPHDATRPLVRDVDGTSSAGSWWCSRGGWPRRSPRTTTEIFHVLSGFGCVTDVDGRRHFFGQGDTVILPKGWSGRWDIAEPIHKVREAWTDTRCV
jgi:uncharacterized cupin superfamily protein